MVTKIRDNNHSHFAGLVGYWGLKSLAKNNHPNKEYNVNDYKLEIERKRENRISKIVRFSCVYNQEIYEAI